MDCPWGLELVYRNLSLRISIMENCKELILEYLKFAHWVVDSEVEKCGVLNV